MGTSTRKDPPTLGEGIVRLPDGRHLAVVVCDTMLEAAAVYDAGAQVLGWQLPPEWEEACEPVRRLLLAKQAEAMQQAA